jgi:formiminoglutamase
VTGDPNWPRASEWLARNDDPDTQATLQILGAPVRLGSISGGRFDLAPGAIRDAMTRFSTYDGEVDLRAIRVRDGGDLPVAEASPQEALDEIAGAVGGSSPHADAVVLLGGDNSITRCGVRGLGPDLGRVGLMTLDAHHDLRDLDAGLTNGNPVRALLRDGLPGANIVQIGLLPFANSGAYHRVAVDEGIAVVTADQVRARGIATVVEEALDRLGDLEAIYVDLDVDVLDRVLAPASPGSRPGGLTPEEVQTAARICGAHPRVRVMDLVEVDPERDVADITVLAAASFVLHFASGLARRPRT